MAGADRAFGGSAVINSPSTWRRSREASTPVDSIDLVILPPNKDTARSFYLAEHKLFFVSPDCTLRQSDWTICGSLRIDARLANTP
jgi:hypothetical protein